MFALEEFLHNTIHKVCRFLFKTRPGYKVAQHNFRDD